MVLRAGFGRKVPNFNKANIEPVSRYGSRFSGSSVSEEIPPLPTWTSSSSSKSNVRNRSKNPSGPHADSTKPDANGPSCQRESLLAPADFQTLLGHRPAADRNPVDLDAPVALDLDHRRPSRNNGSRHYGVANAGELPTRRPARADIGGPPKTPTVSPRDASPTAPPPKDEASAHGGTRAPKPEIRPYLKISVSSFINPREPHSQSAVSTWITADARKEPPTEKPAGEESPAVRPRPTTSSEPAPDTTSDSASDPRLPARSLP
ncbi:uncharacterized protein [Tenebrio molitor]|uniref:uncharacterized protein n=1 Tax=Tenebrio molitor TaxID=7067 RepID=UPI0036248E98